VVKGVSEHGRGGENKVVLKRCIYLLGEEVCFLRQSELGKVDNHFVDKKFGFIKHEKKKIFSHISDQCDDLLVDLYETNISHMLSFGESRTLCRKLRGKSQFMP